MKNMTDYPDVNVLREDIQIRKGRFISNVKNNEHH